MCTVILAGLIFRNQLVNFAVIDVFLQEVIGLGPLEILDITFTPIRLGWRWLMYSIAGEGLLLLGNSWAGGTAHWCLFWLLCVPSTYPCTTSAAFQGLRSKYSWLCCFALASCGRITCLQNLSAGDPCYGSGCSFTECTCFI